MTDKQQKDIEQVKSQLNDIRNVMNISGSTFKIIYAADNFRRFFIWSGIFSLLLPAIYQAMILFYGSQQNIPQVMHIAFYGLIAVCWLFMMWIRTKTSIDKSRELGDSTNIFSIFRQVLSTKMWLAIVPVMLFMIGLQIKLNASFLMTDYIPYYGIMVGLMLNMIGIMIHQREYSIAGGYAIISGAVLFFFFALPMHIAFAIVFAPACFAFAIANKIRESKNEAG